MRRLFETGIAVAAFVAAPALAQHSGHDQHQGHAQPTPAPARQHPAQPHAGHGPDAPAEQAPPASPQRPAQPQHHAGHDAGAPAGQVAPRHAMAGALGAYPMSREASGTAWQPDASRHGGLHLAAGNWTLMGHAALNLVYDWQEGPRGDEMAFVAGMAMGMARRPVGDGTLQFRAMLSPDPLMGRRGYPLHLAAGESADGATLLRDRQHPHDFFMELSASYSMTLGANSTLFLYGGLPGEPAFGPPPFMHRMSIMDSPEAPITHHWLDSTHITFGVVTAGVIVGDVKIEGSRFNGREPDERRWNIETGPLDSTALRLSWNPTANLSLQASWARLIEPEQLAPGENSTRWSASAIYTRQIGREGWWSTTLAWGRRSADHEQFDAVALESAAGLGLWTIFGRAEYAETNELVAGAGGHHGPTFNVGKVSVGAIRDFRLGENVRLGLGTQYARNFMPDNLAALYDGEPGGAMVFVRLRVD